MSEATITWLHLTDLHVGAKEYGHDSELLLDLLADDLERLLRGRGLPPPELVFFTGDLAFSGTAAQYERLDKLLLHFWERLRAVLGHEPKLVPVPGNHDLQWQQLSLDELVLWRSFHSKTGEVRNQFFTSQDGSYWLCKKVTSAFEPYTNWLQTTKLPVLRNPFSGAVPGQYLVSWNGHEGLKLGILALNSAYLDLPASARPGEGGLGLYVEQIKPLCTGGKLSNWFREHHACILLSHHPPSWLDASARTGLEAYIVTANQISLHMCGHLHEVEASRWGDGWDNRTLLFQGRSLSGLDGYEHSAPPSFGYAVGALRFSAGQNVATLRMYPRFILSERVPFEFRPEPNVDPDTQALTEQTIRVRPWKPVGAAQPASGVPGESPPAPDTASWIPVATARELFEKLTRANPDRKCGVYLRGPSRFGKTNVVDWLMGEFKAQPADELRVVARIDLNSWISESQWAPLFSGICEYISEASALNEITAPDLLLFTRRTLKALRKGSGRRVLLLLIFETLEALSAEQRATLEAQLRAAVDSVGYTHEMGGLRLLLVSRFPRDSILVNQAGGSILKPFLIELALAPLSAHAASLWAREQVRWQGGDECLHWLYEQTQGHPEFFTRIVRGIATAAGASWPDWTRDGQGPEARVRGLYGGADGIATGVMTQVVDLVRAMATEFGHVLPSPYQNSLRSSSLQDSIDLLQELPREDAELASGLFVRGANNRVDMIPLVRRVLESSAQQGVEE